MKIDPNQKLTIGARRTLLQLQKELERMLAEKDFSDIQVSELCERTMIPKSTFYHYFEDKFDLLNYLFESYQKLIYPELDELHDHDAKAPEMLKNMFALADKYAPLLERILRKNDRSGHFYRQLHAFIFDAAYRAISKSTDKERYDLPIEIVSRMNAYAIITIFDWVYIKNNPLTREEMIEYTCQLFQ